MRTIGWLGRWLCRVAVLLGLMSGHDAVLTAQAPSQSGRLAYIAENGNVYVTASTAWASGHTPTAITTDATTVAEGPGRSYHRLAWARGGVLAFAAVERQLGATRSELFVATPGAPARRVAHDDEHFVIYLHWSPRPCRLAADRCQLAYLIEGEDAIDLRLVEIDVGRSHAQLLGSGRPFYFSWSPDGRQMLWHRNGARRSQADATLTRYDLRQAQVTARPEPPGFYLAPAWSPTDQSWLDVVEDEAGVRLRYVNGQETRTITTGEYDIAFVWSPDGRQVAYAVRGYADHPYFGPLQVYDVTTGQSRTLTGPGFRVQAFFWSPDSTRLAYLHWLAVPGQSWTQWRVHEVATGRDRGYAAFTPSFALRMIIGSFNQYAQSHRLWSPDGRYLWYADRGRDLVERIWLVDTWAATGAPAIFVDEGVLAVWSWE